MSEEEFERLVPRDDKRTTFSLKIISCHNYFKDHVNYDDFNLNCRADENSFCTATKSTFIS